MYMMNLNHRMTLRLDDELMQFISEMTEVYHLSPSDFIRQLIATQKRTYEIQKQAEHRLVEIAVKEGLENGNDRKTDKHDII